MILGVAALSAPKSVDGQHWSDPPVVTVVITHDQQPGSGVPPRT